MFPFRGRDHWYHELLAAQPDSAPTEHTAAEDTLMLIYTSGTTGKPKGAVHTHCGFPIKATQDMVHGLDLRQGDVFFWMTDMGWMMGPLLVFTSLLTGATMFLYDGAPDHPGPDRVWEMVDRHGITLLGLSPTFVRSIMKFGTEPVRKHSLRSLRAFGTTGEPWNPTAWLWLFEEAGQKRLPILNYSGGTEISGGIVMSTWLTPIKPCSFGGPVPGMAADVVDAEGRPVRGEVGELVIRRPWIGMTRGFWQNPERYLETYWSRLPGIWVHGDWAAIDQDGLWYILGRSDDVIKVAGKRLGPAEVESALARNPAVLESAAIGVPDDIKGRGRGMFRGAQAGRKRRRGTGSRTARGRGRRAGQSHGTQGHHLCARPAAHPQRQDHAPRDTRGVSGSRPRRPVGAREPGGCRGNTQSGAVNGLCLCFR